MPRNGGGAARPLNLGLSPPKSAALAFLFFLLLDGGAFSDASASTDTILPGESIPGNQKLVSKSGEFELGFFSLGSAIHYYLGVRLRNMAGNSPHFWIGDRVVVTDLLTASLEMFAGSLYIKQSGASLWWSPAGNGSSAAVAVLLDDGNLVVRDQGNSSLVLWQSFDYPGDKLLPGARLGLDRDTGKNISLTFKDFSHNGSLSVDASRRNGFVLTTDGHVIRGTFPDWMVSSQDNGSSLLLNRPESPKHPEVLEFHLGVVSLMRWSESDPAANSSAVTAGWVARWIFPSDCESGGFFCGDFGACSSGGKCGCVDGFAPSHPVEWGLGYFVTGCSRSLPLSCESVGQTEHDDSFAPLDKLPGLPYNAQDEVAGNEQDCRAACRSKCYCVAYSYGQGCKLWYHDLYNISSAARPPYTKIYLRLGSKLRNHKGLQTRGIALLVTGSIAISSLVVLLLWLLWRDSFAFRKFEAEGPLVVYSYTQLKKATRGFSDKIGEGGFGSVFRGTMPGSAAIAVKNLKVLGQAEKQFRAEVQTLGMIQHTNLVRLLGFCTQGTRRLLVYEYMPNGSLASHLFSKEASVLSWRLRRRIAIGIAKGLAYLHEECRDCIIHCDIKPENILLDAELSPKIADFGMAKLLGRDIKAALTTLRGTIGYLAPEWLYGHAITHKADVYSFGVVLFELISGKRSSGNTRVGNHRYFPLYAAYKVNEGDVLCLLDVRLGGDCNVKELDDTCRVACWCMQDDEIHRPSMGQLVRMLEGVVHIDLPPIPSSLQNIMGGYDSGIYSAEG